MTTPERSEAACQSVALTRLLGMADKGIDMDLLLKNLRDIGIRHCDNGVGIEAAEEIEKLRAVLATVRSEMDSQDVLFDLWGMVDSALTPNVKTQGQADGAAG